MRGVKHGPAVINISSNVTSKVLAARLKGLAYKVVGRGIPCWSSVFQTALVTAASDKPCSVSFGSAKKEIYMIFLGARWKLVLTYGPR